MRCFKGILCLCLVLMVWVGLALAGGEKTTPVIQVEEPTYDFHQVTQGEVVSHNFRVFNRGNRPLDINKVKPG